jgi:microcystin-dependent protein
MTFHFTHPFVSQKADGTDPTVVRPSAWNADHEALADGPGVVGRTAAGAGPMDLLPLASTFIPSGVGMPWFGATSQVPIGWLACDGSAVSRTLYPSLFTVIGITYGAGDGSTTFNLPDCRGRVLASVDGGTGRLPGFTAPGAAGGASSVGGLPVNVTVPVIGVNVSGSANLYANPSGAEVAAASSGSGASARPHDHSVTGAINLSGQTNAAVTASGGTTTGFGIIPPTIAVNWLIKA